MAYEDFKDLNRRTDAAKILHDNSSNIVKDPKYDGYQRGLASMVYKFFNKKTSDCGNKNKNISDKKLLEGLHKPIMRKYIHVLLAIFGVPI